MGPLLCRFCDPPGKTICLPRRFHTTNDFGVLISCQDSGSWSSLLQKLQAKVQHGKGRDFAKPVPKGRYGLLRFLCVALFEQRLDDTDFARCLVYGSRDLEEGGQNVFYTCFPGEGRSLLYDLALPL